MKKVTFTYCHLLLIFKSFFIGISFSILILLDHRSEEGADRAAQVLLHLRQREEAQRRGHPHVLLLVLLTTGQRTRKISAGISRNLRPKRECVQGVPCGFGTNDNFIPHGSPCTLRCAILSKRLRESRLLCASAVRVSHNLLEMKKITPK